MKSIFIERVGIRIIAIHQKKITKEKVIADVQQGIF
jgi:hypothetical protein